jgi:type I restriction enzyme S subunit
VAEQQRLIELLKEKRQAVISHAVTKGLNPDAPMKDSGVEWLGEVPAHWDVLRLGALFKEVSEDGNDELPILSVSIHDGVSDRQLGDEEMERKVTRSEDTSKYKMVAPSDLVYNMMRAWQGGFGTVMVPGLVSPAYVVARPIRAFSSSFIEQVLRTSCAVEEMRRFSRGVTDFRLRLYWDEFKAIHVAVPPQGEQDAIMDHIESCTRAFDALTAEATRAIDLLQERRTALISAAVTGKIDVRGVAAEVAA